MTVSGTEVKKGDPGALALCVVWESGVGWSEDLGGCGSDSGNGLQSTSWWSKVGAVRRWCCSLVVCSFLQGQKES